MNFLDLYKRLARECGVAGTLTTVVAQTGEGLRLVDWINEAWNDVQRKHQDWEWMRRSASWVTIAGQSTYTTLECGITAGTFGKWDRDTFRVYLTSAGLPAEQFLAYVDYDTWRDVYQFGSQRDVRTEPDVMTITPLKSIALGPTPPVGYTISGDYFLAPSYMALDADIPALPTQFHMMLVYGAMMSYGAFESAPEVYQRGQNKYRELMSQLTDDRLPELVTGGELT